jgi:cytochrome c553
MKVQNTFIMEEHNECHFGFAAHLTCQDILRSSHQFLHIKASQNPQTSGFLSACINCHGTNLAETHFIQKFSRMT